MSTKVFLKCLIENLCLFKYFQRFQTKYRGFLGIFLQSLRDQNVESNNSFNGHPGRKSFLSVV